MPITIDHPESLSVLKVTYSGNVTAEEISASSRQILDIAESRPIYILIDMMRVEALPRNLVNAYFRADKFMSVVKHRNMRAIVYVGASAPIRLSTEFVIRNRNIRFVDQYYDGMAYLRERMMADGILNLQY
jgi:hypothetical protein